MCHTPIRNQLTALGHSEPRPAHVYRCSVCRLELTLSSDEKTMVVAPLDPERPLDQIDRS